MDLRESLVFVILLLWPFDPAGSLPQCSHCKQIEESMPEREKEDVSWRSKRDTADPVLHKNATEDLTKALFNEGRTADFGYGECDGHNTWPEEFPTCSGHLQSPININLAKSIHLNSEYNLVMKNYDELPNSMTLRNSGKTVVIEAQWNNGKRPTIKGGILKGEYVFEVIHFHWGATIYEPSEHLINGYSFPLEMHVVHYKKKYRSFENAKEYDDGIAVIGYIFESGDIDNSLIQKIIDAFPGNPTDPLVNLTPFKINKLAPKFNKDFATYKGSLTTPPCSEIVTWIIYLKPLTLSCSQVDGFRQIKDTHGNPLIRNFRSIQKLNGRKLFLVSKYFFN